jgi:hypothetical protein
VEPSARPEDMIVGQKREPPGMTSENAPICLVLSGRRSHHFHDRGSSAANSAPDDPRSCAGARPGHKMLLSY